MELSFALINPQNFRSMTKELITFLETVTGKLVEFSGTAVELGEKHHSIKLGYIIEFSNSVIYFQNQNSNHPVPQACFLPLKNTHLDLGKNAPLTLYLKF